jgi:hypothetical protein
MDATWAAGLGLAGCVLIYNVCFNKNQMYDTI